MRIAVNTRLLLPDKLEGIGWFTHEALRRIVVAHPDHQFLFLFDRPFDKRFIYAENVEPVVIPPPTRHPLLYRLWFDHLVPRVLRRWKADLFVSTDGSLSLRTDVPQLPVMHDLNFEHYPDDLPAAYSRYYRTRFPLFARKAARIATVSTFSKLDILARYGVPAEKVDVVYNGVGNQFSPLSAGERAQAHDRFTGGSPYFVCVGAMLPRKNLANALAAFDRFAQDHPAVKLLIVGERMFKDARMNAVLAGMRHAANVVFAGRLGQADLRLAMGGSLALVYVSYFEGFGIPLVEAMACGVPVIAAAATSLPEVGGEAAVYADPFDVDDIALRMRLVASDATLRGQLVARGLERARIFTWERTANDLWRSMVKTMERS